MQLYFPVGSWGLSFDSLVEALFVDRVIVDDAFQFPVGSRDISFEALVEALFVDRVIVDDAF